MTPAELRERALALQAWLDAVVAEAPWPPHLQAMIDRCREDLAVVLAAADAGELLEDVPLHNFELLRALVRPQ